MSDKPLDELYFEWLYSQVLPIGRKSPRVTYWNLLRIMYKKEFLWMILNDDNRVEDGKELRRDFRKSVIPSEDISDEWFDLGCSFLELLIALAKRMAFETDYDARSWFKHFLDVLDFDEFSDAVDLPLDDIDEALDQVIWRTYMPNGQGGLFPLKHAKQDQRNVELWYQLNAYLIENDY